MSKLVVAKGKKQLEFDLKTDRPDDAELVAAMTGPTGNLRAPSLVVGKTVIVGFNADLYESRL
jgi:arsenate reductase-like glutaredoxin family protein